MTEGFAESTIDAAIWLIVHQPSRWREFLRTHPPSHADDPPDLLERIARRRISENKARRAREAFSK